jgi:uncharacterized delta-60 repeat protein
VSISRAPSTSSTHRSSCEPLERRQLLAAGALDPSFSDDGKATFGNVNLRAADVALQPDGKTIVVGTAANDSGYSFGMARYNVDGTPDTTFGTGGLVTTRLGSENESEATAVAIQPDGKVVVVGTAYDDSATTEVHYAFAIARYLSNGTLDSSFYVAGTRLVRIADSSLANDVILQNDGKIIVVGSDDNGPFVVDDHDFAIIRLNSDGYLDTSFDGDGKKTISFGATDESASAVAIDYSGTDPKIVMAGTIAAADNTYERFAMVRLNMNGSGDSSFDGDGKLVSPFPGRAFARGEGLLIQPDGRMVVSGSARDTYGSDNSAQFAMARYHSNGVLDGSFGTAGNGFVETGFGGADAGGEIIRSSDGGLIVGGTVNYRFAAAGYDANGNLNPNFGAGGRLMTNFGSGSVFFPVALVAGPGKRFMLTGGPDFATARLLDAGANLVSVATLQPNGYETGSSKAYLTVGRTEALPYVTRVYFNVSGTARYPGGLLAASRDYSMIGMDTPILTVGTPFVDIPAGQTFAVANLVPNDDALVEGLEQAKFTIIPNAAYEIGFPGSATLNIWDNDGGGSIQGTLYNDVNANGVRETNAGEFQLIGRTVYLDNNDNNALDAGEPTFVTNSFGEYRFAALVSGMYRVRQILPSGWTQTSPANNASLVINLATGQDLQFRDLGARVTPVRINGLITGTVYNDLNGNGVKDSGEAGIAGRTVYIDGNNNVLLDTAEQSVTTDANGLYTLSIVTAATYKVREIVPTGWSQTFPLNGFGINVTVAPSQTSSNNNFGVRQTTTNADSISGTVFNDVNSNGIKDNGEVGLSGWQVYDDLNNNSLLDATEQVVLTSSSGVYLLPNLAATTHKVRAFRPVGWSQVLPASNFGQTVTLTAGQMVTGRDFAMIFGTATLTASIAGTVFQDFNRNGIRDTGDTGKSAWRVYIDLNNNSLLDGGEVSILTDGSGNYKFSNLVAGTYKIRIVRPSGWVQTTPSNNFGNNVTLSSGQSATGKNFGIDN